jgi:uncharacterized protein YjbJ (UPF0337 family)
MGQTADELRQQVEAQRGELGRDLEVLGDRVSPGRMVERRKASVRQRVTSMKEAVMGAADTVTPSGDGSGGGSGGAGLTDRASDAASSVADQVGSAPQAVRSGTTGNPLGAGVVAFGAGVLLGSLLPASNREQQAAQQAAPTLQRVAGQAGEVAREAADDLKPAAQDAAEDLKQSAQQSADAVKGQAQDAAQDVQSSAKGAAQDVQSAATDRAESVKDQAQS